MSRDGEGRGRRLIRDAVRIRREVDDEIDFHLSMRIRELESRGYTAAAARAEALRRFGDLVRTRSVCFESDYRVHRRKRRRELVTEFLQDTRIALRQMGNRPGFAAVAIITLAIGIGANTAIFSAADHVLLRPLDNADADEVVTLWETNRQTGETMLEVAPGNFVQWEERAGSFEVMGLAEPYGFDLTGLEGPPEPASVWLVTDGFFDAAGVRPEQGRAFLAEEYAADSRVVVISHRLWQERFGASPDVIGGSIELDHAEWVVVGVLPAGLDYPEYRDVWAPKVYRPGEAEDRAGGYMQAVARLKPGVTLAESMQDMKRVAASMAADYPETNADAGIGVVPLTQHVLGSVRPALLVLLGAVGLVLLVACGNVASLMLARAMERERELGVRVALGAGRFRLIRQLATESGVLAVLGGIGGLGVAWAGIAALLALSPADLPRLATIGIDGRIVAFTAGLTVFTAFLFGVVPSIQALKPGLRAALASGTSGSRGRRTGSAFRAALVIGQISLALILLIGAGLLARSFVTLLGNDIGFSTSNRATIQVFLWDRNPTTEERIQRGSRLRDALAAVPGVEQVAMVSALPFHPIQIDADNTFAIDGRPAPPSSQAPRAYTTVVSPGYFDAMDIALVDGRPFNDLDRLDGPPVALINETFARRYFAGENPLGARVTIGVMDRPVSREIVGVVGDVRPTGLDSDPRPELFVPFAQNGSGGMTYVIRTRTDAARMMTVLRKQVWAVDPGQAIFHASTVDRMIRDTLTGRRFSLVLLGGLAVVGLLLATVGVYGLITFATGQRRGEIAVRMALGARGRDVTAMIVGGAIRLALPGVVLGIVGALYLTRFLQSMLYSVQPTDPVIFAEIALLVIVVAVIAAYLPARRAARTDPMHVLRQE